MGRPDLAPEHIEPRPGDVLRLFADSRKATRVLGHRITVPMADGIADLAARLRALGDDAIRALDADIVVRSWT